MVRIGPLSGPSSTSISEAVGNWAERHGLAYTSYTDLAARPQVYDLIQGEIARVNASLADDPQMAGAQIRRFLILHKELDPDDGELTRTRKVRRRFVAEKYATWSRPCMALMTV